MVGRRRAALCIVDKELSAHLCSPPVIRSSLRPAWEGRGSVCLPSGSGGALLWQTAAFAAPSARCSADCGSLHIGKVLDCLSETLDRFAGVAVGDAVPRAVADVSFRRDLSVFARGGFCGVDLRGAFSRARPWPLSDQRIAAFPACDAEILGVYDCFIAVPLQRSLEIIEIIWESLSAAFVNAYARRAAKKIGIFAKLLPQYMCKLRIAI